MSSRIGNESLDISVENLWKSWRQYKAGKKKTLELLEFEYDLEKNLSKLVEELNNGKYQHHGYRTFIVEDNKRRNIFVASIRDRVVHRLVYEYLVKLFDHTFDFGVWSCRKEKGLIGAIHYCQKLAQKYPAAYFWRADIKKFFESVDHQKLFLIIKNRICDQKSLCLMAKIIKSYKPGLSIGNLTSQIFSNIYLNEFDRFVRHQLGPLGYLRYGDDFVIFDRDPIELEKKKLLAEKFLYQGLKLTINDKNNFSDKIRNGIKFLGCFITPAEVLLNHRNKKRIFRRLNSKNISSYYGILKQFGDKELRQKFTWQLFKYT